MTVVESGSSGGEPGADGAGLRAADHAYSARRTNDRPGTLVVGSITRDYVQAPGVELDGELGGSATYFALASRHFGPVAVVGAVGTDREAELRSTLAFADLSRLTVAPGPTAAWRARRDTVDGDATTLKRFDGAYGGYRPVADRPEAWPRGVFLASCHPEIQLQVAERAPEGALIGGDSMDVFIRDQRAVVERMVRRLRFLVLTGSELEALMRVRGLAMAAAMALNDYPIQAVIAKRGAQGVLLWTRERHDRLRAFPVHVVDPTGAGDALAGAFMGRLIEIGDLSHHALREALEWGLVAASFAISAPGVAGLAGLGRADLDARVAEYRAFEGHL
ncbi:MAG TPA: PfkB family carbohydrate kinase [Candidatus Dormibacteraeota bacterium]|nr:PfkB family carbohydrate kinase [Candidatus Dormibacteraeota bacterium]